MRYLKQVFTILLIISIVSCGSFRKKIHSRADTVDINELNKYGSYDNSDVEFQLRPMNKLTVASGIMLTFPFPPLYYLTDRDPMDYGHYSSYYEFTMINSPEYFIVELLVLPKNNSVEVDLSKIALSVDSNTYYPSGVSGPFGIFYGHILGFRAKRRDYSQLCNKEKVLGDPVQLANISIPKDARQCFALRYNTHPLSPEEKFSMQIESAFYEGRNLEVPKINFYLGTEYILSN